MSKKYPDLKIIKSFPFEDVIVCVTAPKGMEKADYDRQFCLAVSPTGEVTDFDMTRALNNSDVFYEAMKRA